MKNLPGRHTFARKIKSCALKFKRIILQDKLPPEKVALGWAIGMFYGCVIPFGFQLILSVPTAIITKSSKIGASVGTLITNPVSIWFIYPVQCFVANRLMGGNLSYASIASAMEKLINAGNYETLFSLGVELVVSFFAGGILLALVCVPMTYFLVKKTILVHRKKKELANVKR